MKQIRFIREPGYMYDLMFLFSFYFNRDFFLTRYINYNKASEDTAYYMKLLDEFGPFTDDLLLFFYLKDEKKAFITKYYYQPYQESQPSISYNLSTVQEALLDYNAVIHNVLEFYFNNATENELNDAMKSVTAVGKLVKIQNTTIELRAVYTLSF